MKTIKVSNRFLAAAFALVFLGTTQAADWTGITANWSSTGNPGWNGTAPNGVGAIANFGATTVTGTTTQDVAGLTVGTISLSGTATRTIVSGTGIILNQDGGGAGFATISNAGSARLLIGASATPLALILNDDLLIINTGTNTSASGSIVISSLISGTGNVTLSTVGNTATDTTTYPGAIRLQSGASTFTGSVLVQKGATVFNNGSSFGNSANVITMGQSGSGSASLISTAGVTVANNIVAAAGSGGTLVLGSVSAAAGTYSGSLTLNGDLSLSSVSTGTSNLTFSNVISGTGKLTKIGAGNALISGTANTYSGGTEVNAGALSVSASSQLGSNTVGNNVVVNGAILNLNALANTGSNQTLTVGSTSTSLGVLGLGMNAVPTFTQASGSSIVIGINTAGFTAISDQSTVGNGNNFLGSSGTGTFAGGSLAAGTGSTYRLGGGGGTLTITNGVLSGSNSLVAGSALANGGGTVALLGANSLSGATSVNGGTLSLSGATGALASSAVTASNQSTLNFSSTGSGVAGATRAQSVTLSSANLTVLGNSGSNSVDTVTGALTSDGAGAKGIYNTVTLTPNAARNTRLAADNLTRTNRGITLFRGTNLGLNTIASGSANNSNIQFTGSAPALVGGGGAAGTTTISILASAIGGTTTSDGGSTFVTYTATNGIRPLDTTTEFASSIVDGATTTDNVRLTGSTAFTSTTTMNSLIVAPAANTTISGGTLRITSGAVLLNPALTNVATTISSNLDFGGAEGVIGFSFNRNVTISGNINGSNGLTIYQNSSSSPSTTLTLSGTDNTYTGDTYILGQARAQVAGVWASGTRSGDMYVYGSLFMSTGAITTAINGLNGTGEVSYQNTGAGAILSVGNNGASGTFSGSITQTSNSFAFTKTGTGTQVLSGTANTYRAATTINGGVLEVSSIINGGIAGANNDPLNTNASSIGASNNAAANLVLNGGTLRYTGAATSSDRLFTTGSNGGSIDASGSGALNFTNTGSNANTGAGARTLTLTGNNTGNNTISGILSGTIALAKSGTGKWMLTGANTYIGATTVNAGTLLVSNTAGSGLGSGNATVNSGGTLGGSGSFTGTLTVNAGGVLAPGSSIESLASGAVALTASSTFAYEVNSAVATSVGADLQVASGNLTLTEPVTLTLTNLSVGTFTNGTTFSLINYSGAWNSNRFTYNASLLNDDSTFTFNGQTWQIDYNAATGGLNFTSDYLGGADSFVNIVAVVPEPSTVVLVGLSLSVFLYGFRRRKA